MRVPSFLIVLVGFLLGNSGTTLSQAPDISEADSLRLLLECPIEEQVLRRDRYHCLSMEEKGTRKLNDFFFGERGPKSIYPMVDLAFGGIFGQPGLASLTFAAGLGIGPVQVGARYDQFRRLYARDRGEFVLSGWSAALRLNVSRIYGFGSLGSGNMTWQPPPYDRHTNVLESRQGSVVQFGFGLKSKRAIGIEKSWVLTSLTEKGRQILGGWSIGVKI